MAILSFLIAIPQVILLVQSGWKDWRDRYLVLGFGDDSNMVIYKFAVGDGYILLCSAKLITVWLNDHPSIPQRLLKSSLHVRKRTWGSQYETLCIVDLKMKRQSSKHLEEETIELTPIGDYEFVESKCELGDLCWTFSDSPSGIDLVLVFELTGPIKFMEIHVVHFPLGAGDPDAKEVISVHEYKLPPTKLRRR